MDEITVDEFTVVREFGWIHLHDGEGVTRVSMPEDVWLQLCKQTVEKMKDE